MSLSGAVCTQNGVAKAGVVASGPARKLPFGGSLFSLAARYLQLLSKRVRRPLELLAIVLAATASGLGIHDAVNACFGSGRIFMEAR